MPGCRRHGRKPNMKRNPLYSGSAWSKPPRGPGAAPRQPVPEAPAPEPPKRSRAPRRVKAALAWINRHRWAASASAVATVLAAVVAFQTLDRPRTLTQADVDAAVEYTLKHRPTPPSTSSVAAEIIRPSVVRVVGYLAEETTPDPKCAPADTRAA